MQKTLIYDSYDDIDFRRRIRERNKLSKASTTKSPLAWLKQHVSGLDIGEHFPDAARPLHCNTNKRVIEHFASLAAGERSFLSWGWNWDNVNAHCDGLRKLYFAGAGESTKDYTLFMIDVDCKRMGTPEGARKYLEFLRDNYFPDLYFEPSTNGRGGHGYVLLKKCGLGADHINDGLLTRMAPWLNDLAVPFDVEFVEIKGTMPVIEWGDKKMEILSYKSGMLAKVPIGLVDRFEELKNTTVINASDLNRLPYPGSSSDSEPNRGCRSAKEKSLPAVANAAACGSIAGKHFDEETLAGLDKEGRFTTVAEALLTSHVLQTSGRSVVTSEDVAIALMIGEWMTNNMPANGAMPTERWAGMWKALYEAEDVGRGWDHKRFAVIRNYLSSLGLVEWQDESYRPGWFAADGTFVKGKAAKWKFSADLMLKLTEAGLKECEPVAAKVRSSSLLEGRKHPLWKQHSPLTTDWAKSLTRTPDEDLIRPVEVIPIPLIRLHPDYVTQFVDCFETLAA